MKKKISEEKKSSYKATVPAVDQAMQLLNCLAESSNPQLTLTEICSQLKIHKSKAYTILNTLMGYDFIKKNAQTKTYRLGLGIVGLARNILNNIDIRDLIIPHLQTLAKETDLSAHFGQITGSEIYIIGKADSNRNFGYRIRVGTHHHITHGAHGKAIVASMPEAQQQEILSQEYLCFYGDGEPVDMNFLLKELSTCREKGYSMDLGVTNPNINVLAAPVMDNKTEVIGCVILVGAFRRSEVKKFGSMVSKSAMDISHMLGYRRRA
ncbi:MAG: IclR family transcriptional regulator [Desulfobacterium sp.]